MSYASKLRSGKDRASVAFHEFALQTRLKKEFLFVFFEGNDNPYYFPRIKHYFSNICPISCGGRQKVLKVHELIKNKRVYDKYKKAYFIDKDFHKPLEKKDPPIFETDSYSIENLYVSELIFKEIMNNALHISEVNDSFYNACIDKYVELQRQYNEAITLFNAWYACLIDIRDTTGEETGVNLEDKFPKGFLEIDLSGVKSKYNLITIREKFPNAIKVKDADVYAKVNEFKGLDKRYIFRGKYELQFLIKFLQLILQDSLKDKILVKRKLNFQFGDATGLNNDQTISIFSIYAETPDKLVTYIKNVIE